MHWCKLSASSPDGFRVHSFSKVFHVCTRLQIPEIEMITGWCPQTSSAPHEQRTHYGNHHGKDAFHGRTEKHFFSPFLDSLSRKLPLFKCLHCEISDIVQYGMDPRRVAGWCQEWLHPLNIWEASVSAVCRSPPCQPESVLERHNF